MDNWITHLQAESDKEEEDSDAGVRLTVRCPVLVRFTQARFGSLPILAAPLFCRPELAPPDVELLQTHARLFRALVTTRPLR